MKRFYVHCYSNPSDKEVFSHEEIKTSLESDIHILTPLNIEDFDKLEIGQSFTSSNDDYLVTRLEDVPPGKEAPKAYKEEKIVSEYPRLKFSEKLKDENWGSVKGQVFLFIVVANELGLAADYTGMKTDIGVKEKIQYINDKLDSIINKKTGYYWEDDFAGFDSIFEKAKLAKPFLAVENPTFTQEAADLLDEVLKSHIPEKSSAAIPKEEVTLKKAPEEATVEPTVAAENETAAQLKKRIEKEKADREEGNGNLRLSSFLEDENNDARQFLDMDGSVLDQNEEEEEEEPKNNLNLSSFLD